VASPLKASLVKSRKEKCRRQKDAHKCVHKIAFKSLRAAFTVRCLRFDLTGELMDKLITNWADKPDRKVWRLTFRGRLDNRSEPDGLIQSGGGTGPMMPQQPAHQGVLVLTPTELERSFGR
jgi:hypothetical protein